MKHSILTMGAFILPIFITNALHAQDDHSSAVKTVTADELTSILLGEQPMPQGARILKLDKPGSSTRESADDIQEGSIGIGNGSDAYRQSMKEIQLSGEAAHAQAAGMVFRKIAADVDDLGRDNMIKLLSSGQGIEPEATSGFLEFVDETNAQAAQQRRAQRLENCVQLTTQLESVGSKAAIDSYVERQREIGSEMSRFYVRTVESVEKVIGPPLSDYLHEQIESVSNNTVTYRFDHNRYFDLTGESPEDYYLGQCAQLDIRANFLN